MSECRCSLPDGCWSSGPWHLRARPSGSVEAYQRCPAFRSPAEARLVHAGVPEQYRGYTRASFPGEWPAEADGFLVGPTGNVYIYGSNGTGKTHLATAMLGVLLEAGSDGRWASAKLLPELEPERNDGDRATVERYRSAAILVLDDLFSEATFKAERVRNLVEYRYQRARPTIFTSMLEPQRALTIDSDLASRACGGIRIERRGVDRRIVRAIR